MSPPVPGSAPMTVPMPEARTASPKWRRTDDQRGTMRRTDWLTATVSMAELHERLADAEQPDHRDDVRHAAHQRDRAEREATLGGHRIEPDHADQHAEGAGERAACAKLSPDSVPTSRMPIRPSSR